jgi:ABC-type branched-subunit amino acid transport system substrate-binding protein
VIKKYLLISIIIIALTSILIFIFFFKTNNQRDIILGASLPLNGINKELGQEVLEGANSYFYHTNSKGGIEGKRIKLIFYDDKYEPQNTLANTKKLIKKDKVFALFGFVGTPTTKKILPIINDTNIPFIAPYTGASFLRKSSAKNIVNFRSSYKEEIEKIINYLYDHKNITKFAIFYQNDDYGIEGYNAAVEVLSKKGLTLVGEGTYKRNTLSIKHALQEIRSTNPEAIIIVGAYKPSARFIKNARECCFGDVVFTPISFVNANALIKELNGNGKNILFSQTVPSYDDKSLSVANEYIKLLHFYYPASKPTYASFESFLAAKAVVIALQNTNGKITRKEFLENLRNLKTDSLYEIPIKYYNTQLLNEVYLSIYKNGKFYLVNERSSKVKYK